MGEEGRVGVCGMGISWSDVVGLAGRDTGAMCVRIGEGGVGIVEVAALVVKFRSGLVASGWHWSFGGLPSGLQRQ